MRVWAISDVHVDYDVNARWIEQLSRSDYRNDTLIMAGDISDSLRLLDWTLGTLAARFRRVLYVPGNHDLWVIRDRHIRTSLQKFERVRAVVRECGASMETFRCEGLAVVPLLGWYDYSFGQPSEELRTIWMDYHACRWPNDFQMGDVASFFDGLNVTTRMDEATIISFSHFLPRIDVLPHYVRKVKSVLLPVLGSARLESQVRILGPKIHVYGHSHINRNVHIDGITYVNNAFGHPAEAHIASKTLLCIHGA